MNRKIWRFAFCEISEKLNEYNINYELLVVDDGSTDNTPSLLQQITQQYHKVRYIRNDGENSSLVEQ